MARSLKIGELSLRFGVALLFVALLGCSGAKPTSHDLKRAVGAGDLVEVQNLLAAGVDPNSPPYEESGTALAAAAAGSHRAILKVLLAAGADPNLANGTGHTPLMAAASVGDTQIAGDLLEAGALVDAVESRYGTTALHLAALRGHTAVVQRLLEHGAHPLARAKDGQTPGDLAQKRGHTDIVRLLDEAVHAEMLRGT